VAYFLQGYFLKLLDKRIVSHTLMTTHKLQILFS